MRLSLSLTNTEGPVDEGFHCGHGARSLPSIYENGKTTKDIPSASCSQEGSLLAMRPHNTRPTFHGACILCWIFRLELTPVNTATVHRWALGENTEHVRPVRIAISMCFQSPARQMCPWMRRQRQRWHMLRMDCERIAREEGTHSTEVS